MQIHELSIQNLIGEIDDEYIYDYATCKRKNGDCSYGDFLNKKEELLKELEFEKEDEEEYILFGTYDGESLLEWLEGCIVLDKDIGEECSL